MAYKFIPFAVEAGNINTDDNVQIRFSVYNGSIFINDQSIYTPFGSIASNNDLFSAVTTALLTYATTQGYSMTATDIIWSGILNPDWSETNVLLPSYIKNKPAINTPSYNNAPARSIVTGTGATGFQVSSTRDTFASYSTAITTSVSLGGNSSGYVVLEICSTNSATAGNWIEISRVTSGQSGTLVVGLTLNQVGGGSLVGRIPAGYYAKIRSVNVSGTPTYATNGEQEVLL